MLGLCVLVPLCFLFLPVLERNCLLFFRSHLLRGSEYYFDPILMTIWCAIQPYRFWSLLPVSTIYAFLMLLIRAFSLLYSVFKLFLSVLLLLHLHFFLDSFDFVAKLLSSVKHVWAACVWEVPRRYLRSIRILIACYSHGDYRLGEPSYKLRISVSLIICSSRSYMCSVLRRWIFWTKILWFIFRICYLCRTLCSFLVVLPSMLKSFSMITFQSCILSKFPWLTIVK